MIILLVTWFYYNQPPQSTHTAFKTQQTCEVARQQILNDASRLEANRQAEIQHDFEPNPRPDRVRRLRPPVGVGVMSSLSLPSASEWGYQPQKISPDELVTAVSEAVKAALSAYRALPEGRECCEDAKGYFRASVVIELPEEQEVLVHQLMNGPTGYRAHYSVGVEAGEQFNRRLVDAVAPLVIEAEDLYKEKFDRLFCSRSLLGRFSKFWYPKTLTDPGSQDYLPKKKEITHKRWVEYWRMRPEPHKGLLAPISKPPSILLNGTFVNDAGQAYEQKPHRSQQLFESGWT